MNPKLAHDMDNLFRSVVVPYPQSDKVLYHHRGRHEYIPHEDGSVSFLSIDDQH